MAVAGLDLVPFWSYDYLRDSIVIDKGLLGEILVKSFGTHRGPIAVSQSVYMLRDSNYLVLRDKALDKFLFNYHKHMGWMPWREQAGDCDDHTTIWLADMSIGWNKLNFKYPLALGGISYTKQDNGEYHRAGWTVGRNLGSTLPVVRMYEPQNGERKEPKAEIDEWRYFDAG